MHFRSPKTHLRPSPQMQAGGGSGSVSSGTSASGTTTAPTPQNPGMATDANIGIDSEDGRVIDVNE